MNEVQPRAFVRGLLKFQFRKRIRRTYVREPYR